MADTASETKTKTYRGNCHCGAYIYDVELPEALTQGDECNCSHCYKRGSAWAMPAFPRFLRGDPKTLTSYSFGRNMFQHKVGERAQEGRWEAGGRDCLYERFRVRVQYVLYAVC